MFTHRAPRPPLTLVTEVLETARQAAQVAGETIRSVRASSNENIQFKGDRDLVTTADIAAEHAIISLIRERFPDHTILAEESSSQPSASHHNGPVWVIDPVDGTTNFAHGHHQVGVSIGWVFNGRAEVGVVYAPFLGELFHATCGGGAYLNDERINVRDVTAVAQALIGTGFPYDRSAAEVLGERLSRVLSQCRDIRRLGAASLDLCWVACGRLDAFYESGLNPWDGVAGIVIVREAGGSVSHFAPTPTEKSALAHPAQFSGDFDMSYLLVCTPGIRAELEALL
jgi:myo-inositol-1(or 4)-monophosphatase